jgi:outer membrane immunogenic protein
MFGDVGVDPVHEAIISSTSVRHGAVNLMKNVHSQRKAGFGAAAMLGALVLGGAAPALAADLGGSIKDAPVYQEQAPRFSWTGLYLGANLGGAWSNGEATYAYNSADIFSGTNRTSGVIGGGQIGYNWQAGQLVVGIEADIAAQNLSSSVTGLVNNASVSHKNRWVGTLRPRVGYAAGSALLYITGGLAYGNVDHGVSETVAGVTRSYSDSSTRVGWTLGGGIEWALNRNWTLGAEYLHIDLGSTTVSTAAAGAFLASSGRFEDREDIVRAKLNYKF